MHSYLEVYVPTPKDWSPRKRKLPQDYVKKLADHAMRRRIVRSDLRPDWWVVGGRWSGMHPLMRQIGSSEWEKFDRMLDSLGLVYDEEEQNRAREQLFRQRFPEFQGASPFQRDPYKEEGYPDDYSHVSKIPEDLSEYPHALVLPNEIVYRQGSKRWDDWRHKMVTEKEGFTNISEELEKRGFTDGFLITVDMHK